MKQHVIIEKAKRYNISNSLGSLDGCTYDVHNGFWVDNSTNKPMMCGNGSRKPTSKKCDIETGEDQKGE